MYYVAQRTPKRTKMSSEDKYIILKQKRNSPGRRRKTHDNSRTKRRRITVESCDAKDEIKDVVKRNPVDDVDEVGAGEWTDIFFKVQHRFISLIKRDKSRTKAALSFFLLCVCVLDDTGVLHAVGQKKRN